LTETQRQFEYVLAAQQLDNISGAVIDSSAVRADLKMALNSVSHFGWEIAPRIVDQFLPHFSAVDF
jgi:hypothetical protein